MPAIDFWMFVAGLGVFLLGINQMESGIKNLAGKSFRTFLRKHTKNPFKAVLVGVIVTAVLQSSSVVSLMVLAFVGAGIIPLRNAIAIIFGTNLGTTVTGWIVASIGFKFPIDSFALPFLGVGGILITFLSGKVLFTEIGRFLVGFGALFMGLEYMKDAVDVSTFSMDVLAELSIPAHAFFLVGVALTVIIQSSSATMAITLSALYTGIIPLSVAGAIVIGGYLGTTITVMLGALKGDYVKKQVAFAHVGFNFLTSVIALILLFPLLDFVKETLEVKDPLYQLVSFHSVFTLIGIILLFPFLTPYSKFIQKLVKPKTTTLSPLLVTVPSEVVDGATEAIRKEAEDLLERIKKYRFSAFNEEKKSITSQLFDSNEESLAVQYANIQLKEGELITYYLSIQGEKMTPNEAELLQSHIHGIKRMTLAAKNIKEVLHTIENLKQETHSSFTDLRASIQKQYSVFYAALKENKSIQEVEELIDTAYRTNVNGIYKMVQENVIRKEELTSYLHLNSQITQFKYNFSEAWRCLNTGENSLA